MTDKFVKPKYQIGDKYYFFEPSYNEDDLFSIDYGIIIEILKDTMNKTYIYVMDCTIDMDGEIESANVPEKFIFSSFEEMTEILKTLSKKLWDEKND